MAGNVMVRSTARGEPLTHRSPSRFIAAESRSRQIIHSSARSFHGRALEETNGLDLRITSATGTYHPAHTTLGVPPARILGLDVIVLEKKTICS